MCETFFEAWRPSTQTLDVWTDAGVAALSSPRLGEDYPSSIRKVSKFELARNEIFFRAFLVLKSRWLSPANSAESRNLLDSVAHALDRIRISAVYVLVRGSAFDRLIALLSHPKLRNESGERDLRQFASFHGIYNADIQADSRRFGAKFFEPEVVAQGAINSFAIKLFAWMNGKSSVPDRLAVNSIALLHPIVDAAMDKGWMKKETLRKLDRYLFENVPPAIDDDYERMLFSYLARFEKTFPRDEAPGFWFSLGRLFELQMKSLEQKASDLTGAEHFRLALDKGGLSTVMAAYTALGTLSEKQYEFFYRSGGVFQIIDDLIDIEKDRAEGVNTIWSEAVARKQSLADPLRRLLSLERALENDLDRLTSDFEDPGAFASVYSFGFKLSLMRGLARHENHLDPQALRVLAGRMSLSLRSLRKLFTTLPAEHVRGEEGSDLRLFDELVRATELY